jgi:glycosyltransferase involved in cell wall biosynthesis
MKIACYSHSISPSIDGVCRRFTGLLHELRRQGHEVLLFTLEDQPLDLPQGLYRVVTLPHMIIPSYPEKKVARPNALALWRIWEALSTFQPNLVHCTQDGFSHMIAATCILQKIPVLGSFHTDLMDLLKTHHANFFQEWCVRTKEQIDSFVFDSCATTSLSFTVCDPCTYTSYIHVHASASMSVYVFDGANELVRIGAKIYVFCPCRLLVVPCCHMLTISSVLGHLVPNGIEKAGKAVDLL